jgi:hypothetical protein
MFVRRIFDQHPPIFALRLMNTYSVLRRVVRHFRLFNRERKEEEEEGDEITTPMAWRKTRRGENWNNETSAAPGAEKETISAL